MTGQVIIRPQGHTIQKCALCDPAADFPEAGVKYLMLRFPGPNNFAIKKDIRIDLAGFIA